MSRSSARRQELLQGLHMGFRQMSADELKSLRDRLRPQSMDARFEPYKVGLK